MSFINYSIGSCKPYEENPRGKKPATIDSLKIRKRATKFLKDNQKIIKHFNYPRTMENILESMENIMLELSEAIRTNTKINLRKYDVRFKDNLMTLHDKRLKKDYQTKYQNLRRLL